MESTLSMSLSDLAIEVGSYLGFGRTPSRWTGWDATKPYTPSSFTLQAITLDGADSQLGWVTAALKTGLRRFYAPPTTEGNPVAHKWSFLTPEGQLALQTGVSEYDLPDFFAAMEGDAYYQPSDTVWTTVKRVGIGNVRQELQRTNGLTGPPSWVAVEPKPSDGATGQRYRAVFWPVPEQARTLTYRYDLQPDALTITNPYPLGGMKHADTLMESCLAAAEELFMAEQTIHQAAFMQRLTASISRDASDFQPEGLGQNLDRSRYPAYSSRRWHGGNDYVTYYGQVPG